MTDRPDDLNLANSPPLGAAPTPPLEQEDETVEDILREAYWHGELRSNNACLEPLRLRLLAWRSQAEARARIDQHTKMTLEMADLFPKGSEERKLVSQYWENEYRRLVQLHPPEKGGK